MSRYLIDLICPDTNIYLRLRAFPLSGPGGFAFLSLIYLKEITILRIAAIPKKHELSGKGKWPELKDCQIR
jgi:hypothetical protein